MNNLGEYIRGDEVIMIVQKVVHSKYKYRVLYSRIDWYPHHHLSLFFNEGDLKEALKNTRPFHGLEECNGE